MYFIKTLLSYCFLLIAASSLQAQISLEVKVLDISTGQALAEQAITLQNEVIGYLETQTTNTQGKAFFKGLVLNGSYVASTAASDLYYAGESNAISLRSNQAPVITLGLAAKANFELDEVLIGGNSTTRINAVNAEVASSLSRAEIEALPIEGRDISRALYRLPNVSQATGFYPEAPNVAINGANPLFTNYMIDGLDNNERFLGGQKFRIPVGFVQDITVLTNNFSAEFGNTGNGIVNLTSRSGSNETQGEVFLLSRPGPAIDGSSPYPQRDLSGNQVKDGFQRYQAGFAIGGALKKDKTFYYLNAEQIIDIKDNLLNSALLPAPTTVRGVNRFTLLSGKIDQRWNARFRSSLRVNAGLVNIDRQGGGLEGGTGFPSSGNSQDRNSFLAALKNSYTGDRFFSETNVQFSRFRWNYGRADNLNSPQVSVLGPDEQSLAVLGHPGYIFDAHEETFQFQEKLTFLLGQHTLKTGLEAISANHFLFGGGNVNGNYTVKITQAQVDAIAASGVGTALNVGDIPADVEVLNYNVELRPNSFGARQNIFSLYLEDQWSVSARLNLNLGLRYDYDNLSRGAASQGDMNNIAPRLSFNYQLNQRSTLRGGYGIYYDKVLYAIYSDALQQNTTAADYQTQLAALQAAGQIPAEAAIADLIFDGNLSASAAGVPYLNGPSPATLQEQRQGVFSNERRILNPNGYDNPLTHQFALGYQWQLNQKMLFYVDGMHNQSYGLYRLRNLNAAAAYPLDDPENVDVRSIEAADASRPVPILLDDEGPYALINGERVRGVARNIVTSESGGESRFWALTFNLQKDKGDDKFGYRLIYTLSRLTNNTEDINFRAMDANNFEAEWGPSINDRTHMINGFFTWYPLDGLRVSLAALIQSGQPINRIPDATLYGTTDLNGDGRAFGEAYVGNSDRYPGASRNSDRLPWAYTFDLNIGYDIALGAQKIRLSADVFNLLNTANLSGYSNNATQSNQIQVGPVGSGIVQRNAAAPRQFQFGATYLF